MTGRRPSGLRGCRRGYAPTAQPSRAMATMNPVMHAAEREVARIASTAPLMTDESKPKRKPPTAAATARPIALRPNGPRSVNVPVEIDSDDPVSLMIVTLAARGLGRPGVAHALQYSVGMPVHLLGAGEIRALAAELDVTPTKKLGQNFVVDANSVRRIVQVAGVQAGERVVEVGPGLGSLTLAILETGARVTAVEIDHRLAARLAQTAAEHGVAPSPDGGGCRCAAHHRAAGGADGAGREPAVQRLGARAPALPRDVRPPAARCRDGAGGGRGAARRAARLEGLRGAEREGRLVRVAARGHRFASGVLAGAERRQPCWSDSTAPRAARHGGRTAPHVRDRRCRVQQRRKMLRQALVGHPGWLG